MLNYRFAKLYHFFHTQRISAIIVCLKKYFFGIQKNVLPLYFLSYVSYHNTIFADKGNKDGYRTRTRIFIKHILTLNLGF